MPSLRAEPASSLPSLRHPRFRGLLVALAVNGVLQAGLSAGHALLVGRGFDLLFHGEPARAAVVAAVFGAFIAMLVAGLGLSIQERTLSEKLGQRFVHRVRLRLWDHVVAMSARSFAHRRRGAILLRFSNDLTALRSWVAKGLVGAGVAAASVVGGMVALTVLSPSLAVAVAFVVGMGAVGSSFMGRRLRRFSHRVRTDRARLANDVEERVGRLAVVQAFGQGGRERRRLARRSVALLGSSVALARAGGRHQAFGQAAAALSTLAVLFIGSFEVRSGRATVGAAVAALVVSRLLTRPMRSISRAHEYWHRGRVARERLESFLAMPTPLREQRGGRRMPAEGGGALVLRRVRYERVLRGLDVRGEAGQRVLLLGPNGAGKSTLLWLLVGLARPSSGRILLDGTDAGRCSLATLRRAVGIVSPDLPLLRGTVRRNLCYRWPRAPLEEIERVVALCRLDEVLPDLGARVLDGGANLSSGQRQRLALARALVGSPRLLLLDEPESFLDDSGMPMLAEVVASHAGTLIWATPQRQVANRFGLGWDTVWALEDGRLQVMRPAEASAAKPGSMAAAGEASIAVGTPSVVVPIDRRNRETGNA